MNLGFYCACATGYSIFGPSNNVYACCPTNSTINGSGVCACNVNY